MGAALEPLVNCSWKLLAFFSRQLRPPEWKYNAFDLELLTLYLAVQPFRYFLERRVFTAFTDHKLTFAYTKVSDPRSAWQQCHLAAISEYTTRIRHCRKEQPRGWCTVSYIINAVRNLDPEFDFTAMATAQWIDGEMETYHSATSRLVLQDVQFGPTDTTLLCDISTGQPRPVVPATFCQTVFDMLMASLIPPSEPLKMI